MSIQFEIEAGDPRDIVLGVDAYMHRAIVDMQDNRGYGAGATFTADQLRQLRRFLEYCYPASEDPPHEPDPWEPERNVEPEWNVEQIAVDYERATGLPALRYEHDPITHDYPLALQNVHPAERCAGQRCVLHNPSEHHMRGWPINWRDDKGLMERLCPHGIGHPDPDDMDYHARNGREALGVHGCDGCCRTPPGGEG